jgi:hypothetical protein
MPTDPSPGFPPEQKMAGLAAAVGVVSTLLRPVLDIPADAQQDVVLLCTTYGSSIIGAGTILRWRRIGNDKIVQHSIDRADKAKASPAWTELPGRYGGLLLGAAALLIAFVALILTFIL